MENITLYFNSYCELRNVLMLMNEMNNNDANTIIIIGAKIVKMLVLMLICMYVYLFCHLFHENCVNHVSVRNYFGIRLN